MAEKTIRSPICTFVGHVDHGKSSILDAVRESNIVSKEAGAITQAIGASIVPLDTIKKRCGPLLEKLKMNLSIPGLLFIDTPGHAAFTSLRKRGGALADIAIVVVDINEGFRPQTIEAIDILRQAKTPFVIAANKLDLVPGYQARSKSLIEDLASQPASSLEQIDERIYRIIGQLFDRFSINAERFDRVEDYSKKVAIIPCSAKTRQGIAELLMVIAGLAQKYLEENLMLNISGQTKGTVLEVKDSEGLGKSLDVIIYDGTLRVNDQLIIGGVDRSIVTRVRALFQPAPLQEMRDKKSRFVSVKQAVAATGVRISGPGLESVVAGMPLIGCKESEVEDAKQRVQSEVEEVILDTQARGIIIKADSLGALEAVIKLFGEKNIKIRKASIGEVTKKDLLDAESNYENDPLLCAVVSFNVGLAKGVDVPSRVQVISGDIIYKLLDDYLLWIEEKKRALEAQELELLVRPCKIEVLQNCIFRQSNPAVVGVFVMAGVLKVGTPLMKADGKELTQVKSIQAEQENLGKAEQGKQVAVSLPGIVCGRNLSEGNILFSAVPEQDFRQLKKLKKYLSELELSVMKEIAEIMRKQNLVWGV